MRSGQLMSSGILLVAVFMPIFSFAGDLRLECLLLESSTTCDDYKNIQIICMVGSLVGVLLAFIGGLMMRDGEPKQNVMSSARCPRCGSVVDSPGSICFNCAQPGF